MLPQCAQVNFCVFTVAVCQRFSSIVLPVSVSLEVEGQRTSTLLMLRRVFAFARRGGSKKNLVAISESIKHFAGDMREHEMIVRQSDPKHGPR